MENCEIGQTVTLPLSSAITTTHFHWKYFSQKHFDLTHFKAIIVVSAEISEKDKKTLIQCHMALSRSHFKTISLFYVTFIKVYDDEVSRDL